MKEIKRDVYLNKLISRKENGLIKIITGILGHFIKGRDVVAEDFDDIDELDGIDEPGEELKN